MKPLGGLRMSDLVRRTGTPKQTIHYYLREGLLPEPRRTGRNMAYYDESHVERLEQIKRLRADSYLPLSVIKRMVEEGSARRMDLAGELIGPGARTEAEGVGRRALARRSGLSEERIRAFEAAGILRPRGARFGWEDMRLAEILRAADEEAGTSRAEWVLERFAILEKHLREMVREEAAHFFARVLTRGDPTGAAELLRGGRDTIGRYLGVARARALHEEVDAILDEVEGAFQVETPFGYKLSAAARRASGEEAEKERLSRAFARSPGSIRAARALLGHLVAEGDAREAVRAHASVEGRAKASPQVALLGAEAMVECALYDGALAALGRAGAGPWQDLLLGSATLGRLRARLGVTRGVPVIQDLTRGIGALRRAAAAGLADARFDLLLGRVYLAMPAFLGTHAEGREALRRAASAEEARIRVCALLYLGEAEAAHAIEPHPERERAWE